MIKKDLIGHSGCQLEIEENKNGIFVIKTSKDKDYNQRLESQYNKQKNYVSNIFKTPKVFYIGTNSLGLIYFTMEYINGLKLSDYLETANREFLSRISKMICSEIRDTNIYDIEADNIILSKIKDLKTKIVDVPLYAISALQNALEVLERYKWDKCIKSSCHGDFTLENILIKEGDLYVIDFLDSFYDSWLIDIAKIFQDLECLWSYRNYENISENLKTRILILKQMIIDDILLMKNGKYYLFTIYHFLLLNLLRILPYTKDEKTIKYLYLEIAKINNIIKKYDHSNNPMRR